MPSKPFSDWSFLKVCQLYGLGKSDNPSLSVFPPFTCEYEELKEDSSKAILKHLTAKLNACLKANPISRNEALKFAIFLFIPCFQNKSIQRKVRVLTRKKHYRTQWTQTS
ncbi:unnamed protein product [Rhizophagus irregularis]|nr:unnamed protein product [Rhizophagus irregularis]